MRQILIENVGLYAFCDDKNAGWKAQIKFNNVIYYLGMFATELEAAKAYNEAAERYHGEYARLNDVG